jgi:hypothetical protein
MNRPAVFAMLSALALLTACNNKENDGGWTHERREWINSLCKGGPSHCVCYVKEVTTTVTYKEFVQNSIDKGVLVAAEQVCRLTAPKD